MGEIYKGVIWTDHALSRMKGRGIPIDHALVTLNSPQESRRGSTPGAWVYYRIWGDDRIEVVAKENERREWVVLSVWSKKVDTIKSPEPWWKYLFRQIWGR